MNRGRHFLSLLMNRTHTHFPWPLLILLLACSPAGAQPADTPSGKTSIAERGSPHYIFEQVRLHSPKVSRDYLLHIMRPRIPPPERGYPVIFLLDGNAALEDIETETLARLAANSSDSPTVIVALAHDSPRRFDLEARAYDYTPPANGNPQGIEYDPHVPDRRTGGANLFLDFIEESVKPAITQRLPVDSKRLGIWGHSYGGLFVLHVLLSRPDAFYCHIAASPSLWWRQGHLLAYAGQRMDALANHRFGLMLTRGTRETDRKPPPGNHVAYRRWQESQSVPPEALPQLAARMKNLPGAQVSYVELPGLSHGQALTASLEPALLWFKTCSASRNTTFP